MRTIILAGLALALLSPAAGTAAGCGTASMPVCIETTPQAAYDDLQLQLLAGPDAQTHRSLGDLHAGTNALHDLDKARQHWRLAFEAGDGWAGVALAKSFADGEAGDLDSAILVMEEAAQVSQEIRKWADKSVGDLYVRRDGTGDAVLASEAYARAMALGNPWATLPLARSAILRGEASVDVATLSGFVNAGIQSTPDFAATGHAALATLAFEAGDEDRGISELRAAAAMDGVAASGARTELGRRLLAVQGGKEEGTAILASAASSGSAAAALALADDRSASSAAGTQQRALITAYESVAAIDPSFEPIVWARIGDVLSASERKRDHAEAIGWYEKSAAAGNGWANFRLSRAYLAGKGVARSADTAKHYSQQAFEGGAVVPGVAGLFALHGTGQALDGSDLVEIVRLALDVAPASTVADAISWSSPSAQVAFAQQVWKVAGLYTGDVDGIAGAMTLAARREVCGAAGIAACRDRLLPIELIRSIVGDLQTVTASAVVSADRG